MNIILFNFVPKENNLNLYNKLRVKTPFLHVDSVLYYLWLFLGIRTKIKNRESCVLNSEGFTD